jgi:hypothetical protein
MRPLLFSSKSKKGWVRAGKNIKYYYSSTNNNNTNSTNNTNFQPAGISAQSPTPAPAQSQNGRRESKDHTHSHSHPHIHAHTPGSSDAPPPRQGPGGAKPGNFALSFTHTFEFSDDTCYFAYCLPYTYTDLQRYLSAVRCSVYFDPFLSFFPFLFFSFFLLSFSSILALEWDLFHSLVCKLLGT